jgi:hypothetical protein
VTLGVCTPATCRTDADCTSPSLCIGQVSGTCGRFPASEWHCQSPADECNGPGDCMSPGSRSLGSCDLLEGSTYCDYSVC